MFYMIIFTKANYKVFYYIISSSCRCNIISITARNWHQRKEYIWNKISGPLTHWHIKYKLFSMETNKDDLSLKNELSLFLKHCQHFIFISSLTPVIRTFYLVCFLTNKMTAIRVLSGIDCFRDLASDVVVLWGSSENVIRLSCALKKSAMVVTYLSWRKISSTVTHDKIWCDNSII